MYSAIHVYLLALKQSSAGTIRWMINIHFVIGKSRSSLLRCTISRQIHVCGLYETVFIVDEHNIALFKDRHKMKLCMLRGYTAGVLQYSMFTILQGVAIFHVYIVYVSNGVTHYQLRESIQFRCQANRSFIQGVSEQLQNNTNKVTTYI